MTTRVRNPGPSSAFDAKGGMLALALALCWLMTGCASRSPTPPSVPARVFSPATDGFAYTNQLVWNYRRDETGKWTHEKRQPAPDYAQHCFVMARSARQFFDHARFEPTWPKLKEDDYRRLVRQIVGLPARKPSAEAERIPIPGYANLRQFSLEHEDTLKSECGGAWRSYLQRGNWRLVFPFSRSGQQKAAESLAAALAASRPVAIHLARFPQQTINHALLVYECRQAPDRIEFSCYDPNMGAKPTVVTFVRAARTFQLEPNHYFGGGRVDVYAVYRNPLF